MTIEIIHESLVNGQREQMVRQIEGYGPYFWAHYKRYLSTSYYIKSDQYNYFTDATISYHRIKNI